MTRSSMSALMLAAALTAVGGFAIPARAVDVATIKNASTPADHEALAKEYDQEAAQARKNAAKHRAMAEAYASGVSYGKVINSGKGSMKLHCQRLAESYDAEAEQAEALAALHRQLAAKH